MLRITIFLFFNFIIYNLPKLTNFLKVMIDYMTAWRISRKF